MTKITAVLQGGHRRTQYHQAEGRLNGLFRSKGLRSDGKTETRKTSYPAMQHTVTYPQNIHVICMGGVSYESFVSSFVTILMFVIVFSSLGKVCKGHVTPSFSCRKPAGRIRQEGGQAIGLCCCFRSVC